MLFINNRTNDEEEGDKKNNNMQKQQQLQQKRTLEVKMSEEKTNNCANNLIDVGKHSAKKTVKLLYYLFGET